MVRRASRSLQRLRGRASISTRLRSSSLIPSRPRFSSSGFVQYGADATAASTGAAAAAPIPVLQPSLLASRFLSISSCRVSRQRRCRSSPSEKATSVATPAIPVAVSIFFPKLRRNATSSIPAPDERNQQRKQHALYTCRCTLGPRRDGTSLTSSR